MNITKLFNNTYFNGGAAIAAAAVTGSAIGAALAPAVLVGMSIGLLSALGSKIYYGLLVAMDAHNSLAMHGHPFIDLPQFTLRDGLVRTSATLLASAAATYFIL